MNELIVDMVFGSHVYGTNTPSSDKDYKRVSIPNTKDILLQRAYRAIHTNTKQNDSEKNTPDDVDCEEFSLHYFFKLLLEGQTITIDMLFVPEQFITHNTDLWKKIIYHRKEFISAKTEAFIGYCRTQANKYGIKGSRMSAAKNAVECFCSLPLSDRLSDHIETLDKLVNDNESIEWEDILNKSSNTIVRHLSVCGRKVGLTVRVDHALNVYNTLYQNYGERTRQAMNNENIDWKAMMHAVRIIQQAQELRATGNITFPRPNADELTKIRTGQLDFKQVSETIEQGVYELDNTPCILRPNPNIKLAEQIIIDEYSKRIIEF